MLGNRAVIWLRYPTSDNNYSLPFVTAKAFVAPVKKRSIPRLEVTAAVILTRLILSISRVIKFDHVAFCSDSVVVLHWLNSTSSNFKPFVATRIQEIHDSLQNISHDFRYVKSSLNPADSLIKPIKASQLSSWHEGPEFLKGFISKEPLDKNFLQNAAQMFKQEEKNKLCLSLHLSTVLSFAESLANRTLSWMRLVRIVAWLRRPLLLHENCSIDLQPSELNDAKLTLFWLAQEMFRRPDQRRLRQRLNMVLSEDERVNSCALMDVFQNVLGAKAR